MRHGSHRERRFFSRSARCGRVKVVYCDHCKDISIKSRLEGDMCNSCGRSARPVPYSRPWQYYASSVVLLVATALAILVPIPDLLARVGVLAIALAIALALSSWFLRSLRARILNQVRRKEEREAKT